MNKVSIQIICLTLFLLSLHKYCFFVSVTLVSFILKCYPLFCINFFYLKVVFHQIRLNLSCANFQYTIFFSIRIYQGCALREIEGSPVLWTCEIHCAQHIISMKKQRFSSPGRAMPQLSLVAPGAHLLPSGNQKISDFSYKSYVGHPRFTVSEH